MRKRIKKNPKRKYTESLENKLQEFSRRVIGKEFIEITCISGRGWCSEKNKDSN